MLRIILFCAAFHAWTAGHSQSGCSFLWWERRLCERGESDCYWFLPSVCLFPAPAAAMRRWLSRVAPGSVMSTCSIFVHWCAQILPHPQRTSSAFSTGCRREPARLRLLYLLYKYRAYWKSVESPKHPIIPPGVPLVPAWYKNTCPPCCIRSTMPVTSLLWEYGAHGQGYFFWSSHWYLPISFCTDNCSRSRAKDGCSVILINSFWNDNLSTLPSDFYYLADLNAQCIGCFSPPPGNAMRWNLINETGNWHIRGTASHFFEEIGGMKAATHESPPLPVRIRRSEAAETVGVSGCRYTWSKIRQASTHILSSSSSHKSGKLFWAVTHQAFTPARLRFLRPPIYKIPQWRKTLKPIFHVVMLQESDPCSPIYRQYLSCGPQ